MIPPGSDEEGLLVGSEPLASHQPCKLSECSLNVPDHESAQLGGLHAAVEVVSVVLTG